MQCPAWCFQRNHSGGMVGTSPKASSLKLWASGVPLVSVLLEPLESVLSSELPGSCNRPRPGCRKGGGGEGGGAFRVSGVLGFRASRTGLLGQGGLLQKA